MYESTKGLDNNKQIQKCFTSNTSYDTILILQLKLVDKVGFNLKDDYKKDNHSLRLV